MIADPSLIFYACIANGTTILAEFNSKDADLGALASQCLEKTPPFHSTFTHTVRNKTYTFYIDGPFVYFGIFDEIMDSVEGISFLKSVNDAFNRILDCNSSRRLDNLNSHCFQGEFNPVFHQLLATNEFEAPHSPRVVVKHDRSGSLESSSNGKMIGSRPLLRDAAASKSLMKKTKKRLFGLAHRGEKESMKESKVDVLCDDGIGLSREFSVVMQKNSILFGGEMGPQKAKRVWKKHVWVVLSVDLVVCSVLFAIWLWVCRGFQCVQA